MVDEIDKVFTPKDNSIKKWKEIFKLNLEEIEVLIL